MASSRENTNPAPAILPADLRAQLDAAWQAGVERLASQLMGDWRSASEAAFQEHLAAARVQSADGGRRALSEEMNQMARRLRASVSHADWMAALLEAASRYSARTAFFSTMNHRLRCEASRNMEAHTGRGELVGLDIPLEAAPAFHNAVETRDPVVALMTAAETSESVAEHLSGDAGGRAHIYPLIVNDSVVAVLYGEPRESGGDAAALELLATVAAVTLEKRLAAPEGLVAIAPAPQTEAVRDWKALPKEERQLHVQAQRYAKWTASQMRLSHGDTVRDGRRSGDLYTPLQKEIDAAREEYRRRFMEHSPHMVDYLHIELVRTLANDDSALLGPSYPGPLV